MSCGWKGGGAKSSRTREEAEEVSSTQRTLADSPTERSPTGLPATSPTRLSSRASTRCTVSQLHLLEPPRLTIAGRSLVLTPPSPAMEAAAVESHPSHREPSLCLPPLPRHQVVQPILPLYPPPRPLSPLLLPLLPYPLH